MGLRRGGNYYYALDVTHPDSPTLMWSISPSTPGYSKLGQTWSQPVLAHIETGTDVNPQTRDVLVFGGGYDTRQDNYSPNAPDPSGNAIYIADAHTGALVWSGSDAGTTAIFRT